MNVGKRGGGEKKEERGSSDTASQGSRRGGEKKKERATRYFSQNQVLNKK